MTHHRILAYFQYPGCIPNPAAIHRHLADQALDLGFVPIVGVVGQKTFFARVTAIALRTLSRVAVPFHRFCLPTLRAFYCFVYHDAKLQLQHI